MSHTYALFPRGHGNQPQPLESGLDQAPIPRHSQDRTVHMNLNPKLLVLHDLRV